MGKKLPLVEVSAGRWRRPEKLSARDDAVATMILAQKGLLLDELGQRIKQLACELDSYPPSIREHMHSRLPDRVRRMHEGMAIKDVYWSTPVSLKAFEDDIHRVAALVDELASCEHGPS